MVTPILGETLVALSRWAGTLRHKPHMFQHAEMSGQQTHSHNWADALGRSLQAQLLTKSKGAA